MSINPYIPIEVSVKELSPGVVGLSWDIDSSISTRPGLYYKLYMSQDGVKYSMLKSSISKFEELQSSGDPYYIKLTSVIPSMGESAMSDPIKIYSVPRIQGEVTVAVDPRGVPANLRVDENGNLLAVLSDAINVKFPQLDTARRVVFGNLRAEYVSVTSDILQISFTKRAYLKHLMVIKESGSATSFTASIYNKLPASPQYNIAQYDCASGNRLDVPISDLPFVNLSSADTIYIKLTPNTGTDNVFYVYISGEPARA